MAVQRRVWGCDRNLVGAKAEAAGTPLWRALPEALRDHTVVDREDGSPRFPDGCERRAATLAPCVHTDGYGTRLSALVRLSDDDALAPDLLVADGPPAPPRSSTLGASGLLT